jgi:hypothetical protein
MQFEISTCYDNLKAVFVQEPTPSPQPMIEDPLNLKNYPSFVSVGLFSRVSPNGSTVVDSNITTPYSQYYYQSPLTSGKPSMDPNASVISSGGAGRDGGKSFTLKAHGV